MGNCCECCNACCLHVPETPSPPIPEGKTRICVTGPGVSRHTARARKIVAEITRAHGDKYESWFYFTSMGCCCGDGFWPYIIEKTKDKEFPPELKGHDTAPFIWFENGPNKEWTLIGGRHELAEWAKKTFPDDKEIVATANDFHQYEPFHDGCCKYSKDDDIHMFSTCLMNNGTGKEPANHGSKTENAELEKSQRQPLVK